MISDDDVDDTSTTFELFVTIMDGIDDTDVDDVVAVDDERWFEVFWCDDKRSIEEEESDDDRVTVVVAGGGGNEWESTETVDDGVSKHI